jgi:hypothetical protein
MSGSHKKLKVCRYHAHRVKMVPLGRGWIHADQPNSDECLHGAHKGEVCNGNKTDCPDRVEKQI